LSDFLEKNISGEKEKKFPLLSVKVY